jgi:pyruvate-formate lyase-activating enzyme
MQSKDKFFPIKTKTACQLKWAWSTIFLNTGTTGSCHRTAYSEIDKKNFMNFHNTPLKIKDREKMLQGEWPDKSCKYCKKIEDVGGQSDRIRMLAIPNLSPPELEKDPTLLKVDPTLVEVYLSNACQMSCLYCNPNLSSGIEAENRKHGPFMKSGVQLKNNKNNFKDLLPVFWTWFETGFQKVKRFHVLGGEPFFQKEFVKMLDMIEKYPNPDCELNIVTNLMTSHERLKYFIDRFNILLKKRFVKRIDITCSIDCWGTQQEYVRYGINLEHWEKNFNYLIDKKWITLHINQTISVLTIKTMPDLLKKLKTWREKRPVGHFFSGVHPDPEYLKGEIIGENFFKDDTKKILELLPNDTKQNKAAKEYMSGILNQINSAKTNKKEIENLIIYLNEKDRRRGTDWKKNFPWLIAFNNQ